MLQASIQRSHSLRLSVLLLMLGASVFLWGLGYKLSQYESHGYPVPAAKLLSSNEDSSAVAAAQLCAAEGSLGSAVLVTFLSMTAVLAGVKLWQFAAKALDEQSRETPPTRLVLSALFFRPPPIHSVL